MTSNGCLVIQDSAMIIIIITPPDGVGIPMIILVQKYMGPIAAPRGVMDIEVTNSPELSVVEPLTVPSRISVVLEAKAGGTQRLGCPRVYQDLRLLAGVAKLASVTGKTWIAMRVGTLSSSDLAGRLFPVVPAGIPFPVGPVDPAGPDGLYVAGGPVGPCGTLSRLSLTLLARMARMLQVALLARMGHCPRLTLNLLALMARMLQVALFAHMGRCPRLSLTLLARMARMLQVALLARM